MAISIKYAPSDKRSFATIPMFFSMITSLPSSIPPPLTPRPHQLTKPPLPSLEVTKRLFLFFVGLGDKKRRRHNLRPLTSTPRRPFTAGAHSSRHAAAWGCVAYRCFLRSIASILRPPKSTGRTRTAADYRHRRLRLVASILVQVPRRSSTVSTKILENHYGPTSWATASRMRHFASTATKSSYLRRTVMSMPSSNYATRQPVFGQHTGRYTACSPLN